MATATGERTQLPEANSQLLGGIIPGLSVDGADKRSRRSC